MTAGVMRPHPRLNLDECEPILDIGVMRMLQEESIGESQEFASYDERRRSHREPVVTVGTLRAASDSKEAGRQVLVSDVSLHGVGMRTTFELALGEIFMI